MNALKLSALTLALASAALAQATVVTKEGVGEAAIVKNDEQKAFEEAKDRALRAAVEQAAGVRIDADTVVVNNQLVRDQVFANTSGYVKKFDVVDKKVEKGVLSVKVKADVITENLDKDITAARDLVKRMGRPSIVIVVQEQTVPMGAKVITNSETMATVLFEAFKADGWDIKDPQAINKSLSLEGAATLGATEVKKISDLTKANYVLYGKSVMRHEDPGEMLKNSHFYPVAGEYDLSLASTDSAQQLVKVAGRLTMSPRTKETSISYERTAFNVISERKAEIITPVRRAILEEFRNQAVNGKTLAVVVGGLDSFGAAKDFKKAIEAMKGIKDASQDEFANGKASYRVTFLGSAQDFAESVEAATFKKKKLVVVSQSGNTLEIQVGK